MTEDVEPAEPAEQGPHDRLDVAGAPPSARRRVVALVSIGAVVVLSTLAVMLGRRDAPEPLDRIRVDAWAPYWAMDRSIVDLERHGSVLHDISPFAYEVTGIRTIGLPATIDEDLVPTFVERARAAGLSVTPSIVDALASGEMAAVLADPTTRARHVRAIVDLAAELDTDGIDIDYEKFAFDDDRSTWPTTRTAFADFVDELATALQADGRRLVVSVPPVYDAGTTDESGYWVYDIDRLAESADEIRVMAYGFSGNAAGPVSPLTWVEQSVDGVVGTAGGPERIVLGIPLYGTNVPVSTTGTCPDDAPGTTAVTLRTIDDLIVRRDAEPTFDPDTGEWTFTYELTLEGGDGEVACTQTREVSYVDAAGARARIDIARTHRLAGVSLWGLGYEDDAFWDLLAPVAAEVDPSTSDTGAD